MQVDGQKHKESTHELHRAMDTGYSEPKGAMHGRPEASHGDAHMHMYSVLLHEVR